MIRWVFVLGLAPALSGCKPPEPTPSQYVDLGTADSPLPPSGPAWHDPGVAKGTADWKPFRKLSGGNEATASAKPAADPADDAPEGDPDAGDGGEDLSPEEEIRALVADFNAALADKKLEEAGEYLSDEQAGYVNDVLGAVDGLVEQLRLLATAAPPLSPKVDALAPVLNLSDSLQMKVDAVRIEDRTAVAPLENGSEARFRVGEEDLWYLESPLLNVLNAERARLQKLTEDIKAALSAGTPDEARTTELGFALDELLVALTATPKPHDGV
jgi:hypothetical protein